MAHRLSFRCSGNLCHHRRVADMDNGPYNSSLLQPRIFSHQILSIITVARSPRRVAPSTVPCSRCRRCGGALSRRSPPAERAASSVSRIMARKPKSLAGNNKIGSDCSGNGREPRRVPRIAVQTNIILQDRHREPGRRAFLPFGCLVCRPLLCGDLGAVLACIEHFRVLTSWTLERNDLRRRPHLLERALTAFGMWP